MIIVSSVRRHRRNKKRQKLEEARRAKKKKTSPINSPSNDGDGSKVRSTKGGRRSSKKEYNFLALSTVSEKSNECTATVVSSHVPDVRAPGMRTFSGQSAQYQSSSIFSGEPAQISVGSDKTPYLLYTNGDVIFDERLDPHHSSQDRNRHVSGTTEYYTA